MLASPVGSLDETLEESIAQLANAVAAVRHAARNSPAADRADAACVALRTADELTALAIECLDTTDVERVTGLSAQMLLQLEAGRMGSEARMITGAAASLHAMPNLSAAFGSGLVSWGQVRAITSACKTVRAEGRAEIDELIGRNAPALAGTDPDRLVALVDDAVAAQRADLLAAREQRAIDRSFLSIQPQLDGTAAFFAQGDAESGATITAAVDAAADPPEDPDKNGISRGRQRYEGLVRVCEAYLAGNTAPARTRPRPRVMINMDLKDLTDPTNADALNLLWPLRGRPPALSSVARDMLLCDATLVPVVFNGAQPVAVGDAADNISPKVRTALIARDAGCRFPGCDAPAQWCDAHHIIPGDGNQANDLILLCRRCHRRLHARNWRMKPEPDGGVTFTRRGQKHTTYPRHRSPPKIE
jgi:hypothetical protein